MVIKMMPYKGKLVPHYRPSECLRDGTGLIGVSGVTEIWVPCPEDMLANMLLRELKLETTSPDKLHDNRYHAFQAIKLLIASDKRAYPRTLADMAKAAFGSMASNDSTPPNYAVLFRIAQNPNTEDDTLDFMMVASAARLKKLKISMNMDATAKKAKIEQQTLVKLWRNIARHPNATFRTLAKLEISSDRLVLEGVFKHPRTPQKTRDRVRVKLGRVPKINTAPRTASVPCWENRTGMTRGPISRPIRSY